MIFKIPEDQRMKLEKYNKKPIKKIVMFIMIAVKEYIIILLGYK